MREAEERKINADMREAEERKINADMREAEEQKIARICEAEDIAGMRKAEKAAGGR